MLNRPASPPAWTTRMRSGEGELRDRHVGIRDEPRIDALRRASGTARQLARRRRRRSSRSRRAVPSRRRRTHARARARPRAARRTPAAAWDAPPTRARAPARTARPARAQLVHDHPWRLGGHQRDPRPRPRRGHARARATPRRVCDPLGEARGPPCPAARASRDPPAPDARRPRSSTSCNARPIVEFAQLPWPRAFPAEFMPIRSA